MSDYARQGRSPPAWQNASSPSLPHRRPSWRWRAANQPELKSPAVLIVKIAITHLSAYWELVPSLYGMLTSHQIPGASVVAWHTIWGPQMGSTWKHELGVLKNGQRAYSVFLGRSPSSITTGLAERFGTFSGPRRRITNDSQGHFNIHRAFSPRVPARFLHPKFVILKTKFMLESLRRRIFILFFCQDLHTPQRPRTSLHIMASSPTSSLWCFSLHHLTGKSSDCMTMK